ncbi:MAG: hypothetical protein QME68_04385 [Elusimicrobiota bacterium]|nr:hypothetical protein [Elusimicrobiota bacterium]
MYYFTDRLVFSVAGQNLGSATKFTYGRQEKLPASVWAGVGYTGMLPTLGSDYYYAVGGDIPYILDEQRVTPSIGVEFGKLPVSIFVAYRLNVEEGILNVGMSFTMKNFDISYSYIPTRWLSPTHRVSFGIRFGSGT